MRLLYGIIMALMLSPVLAANETTDDPSITPVSGSGRIMTKAEKRRIAQRRASTRFVNQIRTTMDELFGLDVAGLFARLGYPTEEKRILGKKFVIWRRVGPEVEESSFVALTNTWGGSITNSTTHSTTHSQMRGESKSKTEAVDRWGRQVPVLAGWEVRTSGSYSGSSESQTSSHSTIKTSTSGGSRIIGKGKAIKYKIECTLTLEVDEHNRVKGWKFARDSDLDYCVKGLNIKPSLVQLVDEELVNMKKEKKEKKRLKAQKRNKAKKEKKRLKAQKRNKAKAQQKAAKTSDLN